MQSPALESGSPAANPIDLVEEVVLANEWQHERANDEELMVEIAGRWCDYRLLFVWQREMSALHFTCGFEMRVPRLRRAAVYELLATVNERLWLGHFDLAPTDQSPAFRHGVLLRGASSANVEQIEDLVDLSLSECERFYPAFQFVVWGGKSADEAIASAMIDPIGEA